MKLKPFHFLSVLWLALALAIVPALRAQETPPPAPAPAKQPAPPATAAATQTPPPAASDAVKAETADDQSVAASDDEKKAEPEKADTAVAEPAQPAPAEQPAPPSHTKGHNRHISHNSNNERVSFFHDSTLAAGETADAVVSILGSSTSAGEVGEAVVSVFGSSTTSGNVGDAVVSIVGNSHVTGGTVGDTVVAVLGSDIINGHVKGQVVAVLGNVELGPDAVVDGGIVCVGGEVIRDAKSVVHGDVQNIAIGGHHFNFNGLHAWFEKCLLYGRPLAFGEHLMWAWLIALACLGFYALLALVAPAGVESCVRTLEERPGKSILAAVLTLLLTPVAYLLLVLTLAIGLGFVLIPLFSLGLFFAGIFGKVVMLAWVGRRVTKLIGNGATTHAAISVLIGGVVVLLLYTVPILGFVVYKLVGTLGLGVVIYTLMLALRSSRAAAAEARTRAAAAAAAALPPVMGDAAGATTPAPTALPPVISAATLPRAGFWRRVAAAFLDLILVAMVSGIVHSVFFWFNPGGMPFWLAIYSVAMWATKGTTIGGIVCGLKIVRLDDRPVDWGVAVVRGLSAFLSLVVAGLGFIWVAFDDDRQSWHDKIAGTTIVKVPKGTSLL